MTVRETRRYCGHDAVYASLLCAVFPREKAIKGEAANVSRHYRWNIAARVLLAFVGGFVWISVFGAMLATAVARLGWMPIAQGVHIMTLFSYVAWCGVAIWVFYEQRLGRVLKWMLSSGCIFSLCLYALK
ncbi:MAG: hypothetical protein AAGI44_06880 [Pseudomonadota bacterium]